MQKRCTRVKMLSRCIACLFGREETSNSSLSFSHNDACNINSMIGIINSINGPTLQIHASCLALHPSGLPCRSYGTGRLRRGASGSPIRLLLSFQPRPVSSHLKPPNHFHTQFMPQDGVHGLLSLPQASSRTPSQTEKTRRQVVYHSHIGI